MATPNASRNIAYHFPSATFRNAIRFVFEMESPPDATRRISFHFADALTFTGPRDSDMVPFNPAGAPVRVVPAPVSVPCDIEFIGAPDEPTAFGAVVASKLRVLLLDLDYQQVKDATFVVVNGDRYKKHYEPPATALFDVGLHQMVFVAEDEV